jgi:hypothetical protein
MAMAVRDIVDRLDARPVPPGGVVGARKGGITRIVEVSHE